MEVATSIREDDGKTQVTVELTAEEVKPHIDAHFKDLAKNRIPGFRPGRAPRRVLEQNFGGHDYIYAQITTDLINEVAPVAVDGQDILFVTGPDFDESDEVHTVADGEPFSFVVYGEVKPTVELSGYDPVEISMPDEQATDADIEMQLSALQQYYQDMKDVDRPAMLGDYVLVDIDAVDADGNPVEELNASQRLMEVSAVAFPKLVAEEIVGMSADEEAEFDAELDGEMYEYLEGKPAHVKLRVSAVRAMTAPELDDEFAKKAGFDTIEALREEIRTEIENAKGQQLPELKQRRCLNELAARIDGEVSASYVDFVREDILRDFFNQLQRQGTTFDAFLTQNGITSDDFQKDLDAQAKENAEQSLALDALAAKLDLIATDEEIDREFQKVEDPEKTRTEWEQSGRMSVLREALCRQKATEWLVENALVTIEDPESESASDE